MAENGGFGVFPADDIKIPQKAETLLIDINNHPNSGIVERYKRLNLSMRVGDNIKNYLLSNNFIETKELITKSGKIVLVGLTEKGLSYLRKMGIKTPDHKNGIEHKYWKYKIAKYYMDKGYKVVIEKPINGNADIVVTNDNKLIAIEIETGKSYAIKNIQKDLEHGFDMVISIGVNNKVTDKIKKDLINSYLDKNEKVKVVSAVSFDSNL